VRIKWLLDEVGCKQHDNYASQRVAACLRHLGWVQGRRTKSARLYVPGPTAEPYEGPVSADEAPALADDPILDLVD
jgi:hypothetical protein